MANPIASGTFSKATLVALAQGKGLASSTALVPVFQVDAAYRVQFNPANAAAEVDVWVPDTVTGMPGWQAAVNYTAV